jgi:hypothetical protein
MDKPLVEFISRKFLMALATLIVSTILVWFAKIDPTTYGNILQWVIAAYVVSNVAEKRVLK